MFEWIRQRLCNHQLQGDRQITLVRCTKCQKEYWYEKGVDLFPPNTLNWSDAPCTVNLHPYPISGEGRTRNHLVAY